MRIVSDRQKIEKKKKQDRKQKKEEVTNSKILKSQNNSCQQYKATFKKRSHLKQNNRQDGKPDTSSRSPYLEPNSDEQAGPAYLGKERENRSI